jgi:hypothetical protein
MLLLHVKALIHILKTHDYLGVADALQSQGSGWRSVSQLAIQKNASRKTPYRPKQSRKTNTHQFNISGGRL